MWSKFISISLDSFRRDSHYSCEDSSKNIMWERIGLKTDKNLLNFKKWFRDNFFLTSYFVYFLYQKLKIFCIKNINVPYLQMIHMTNNINTYINKNVIKLWKLVLWQFLLSTLMFSIFSLADFENICIKNIDVPHFQMMPIFTK